MRKTPWLILLAATLTLALAAPVAARPHVDQWHRLNIDPANVTSEHERLTCLETRGAVVCSYDKVAEPGFHWNATVGLFAGRDVTKSWTCPDWFPAAICDNVVSVHAGHSIYLPDGGKPFTVREEYVVTDVGGQLVLQQYWVNQFVCPWFRTFAEAQAANPGGSMDCILPG